MNKYDTIIIGGGPAGLTAGLYASRAGLKSLLIEKAIFGGQIVNAHKVDNYPGFPEGISGYNLATFMHQQAIKFGLEILNEEVNDFRTGKQHIVTCSETSYAADSIIIATGSKYNKLGVEGEEGFLGRGVSYCATCDGFMFKGREVAVVGGGDTAISDALELTQHASKVYLIHRRDQLRASRVLQNQAFAEPKLSFIWNSTVESIRGDKFVSTLTLKNLTTNDKTNLSISGVFVAVGVTPNSELFKNMLSLDKAGLLMADLSMATSIPGIFAAGDIRSLSSRQVSTAVGDGATAALSAFKYVRQQL